MVGGSGSRRVGTGCGSWQEGWWTRVAGRQCPPRLCLRRWAGEGLSGGCSLSLPLLPPLVSPLRRRPRRWLWPRVCLPLLLLPTRGRRGLVPRLLWFPALLVPFLRCRPRACLFRGGCLPLHPRCGLLPPLWPRWVQLSPLRFFRPPRPFRRPPRPLRPRPHAPRGWWVMPRMKGCWTPIMLAGSRCARSGRRTLC